MKGWDLLTAKLRDLGIKEKLEEERVVVEHKECTEKEIRAKEGGDKRTPFQGRSFAEVTRPRRNQLCNMIWVNVGEILAREAMGTLKYCLVESWENPLDSYPSVIKLEA